MCSGVIDFFTAMALEGRIFQVKAGALTTPVVGDVAITDQVAEMAVEAPTGLTIMPCFFNLAIRLGTGTLFEAALKARPWTTAITFTTAFVPLPLYIGGAGSMCRAYVDAAGAVDVGANESLTLDRLLYHWANPIAFGAITSTAKWEPTAPPAMTGRSIVYAQIAGTGTGPSYFAVMNHIELPTINVT